MASAAVRVSTGSAGEQANGFSTGPIFLADGRTLVFSSTASNLVAGDTNGKVDVFAKDLVTGGITRLTSESDGSQIGVDITSFTVSANGSTIAYVAAPLGASTADLYTKDFRTGEVIKVTTSRAATGLDRLVDKQGLDSTIQPQFSDGGHTLLFASSDASLVPGDTNDFIDVFAKDLTTGLVTRVSTSASGGQATTSGVAPYNSSGVGQYTPPGDSSHAFFTEGGRKVVFTSDASDLVPGDTNKSKDVFIKDLSTGELSVVANASYKLVGNVSDDGAKILLQSYAVTGGLLGLGGIYGLFSNDIASGATTGIDFSRSLLSNGDFRASYTQDGSQVLYQVFGSSPTEGYATEVYRKDLETSYSNLTSRTFTNGAASGFLPVYSPDGTKVAFASNSTAIVEGDTNGASDIFVKDLTDPVFGQRVYDASSTGGKIYALYDALLGRAPDAVGLSAFTAAANGGVALQELAQSMLQSPEGQARAGAASNAEFITQLYRATLHREPDAGGLGNWVWFLDSGGSRADVGLGFALSTEHLNNIQGAFTQGIWVADATASAAARLYYGVLNRMPDAPGLSDWTAALKQGASIVNVAQVFLNSTEGKWLNGQGDAAFVDQVYVNALGRHAEASGLAAWTNYLGNGGSRAELAVAISEGPEAQAHLTGVIEKGWFLI